MRPPKKRNHQRMLLKKKKKTMRSCLIPRLVPGLVDFSLKQVATYNYLG